MLVDADQSHHLTPAQQSAADRLVTALAAGSVLLLRGHCGTGKTTILHSVRERTGGILLGMRDFIDVLTLGRPDAIEQAFVQMMEHAIADHKVILVDDFHLITAIANHYNYNRGGLLDAALVRSSLPPKYRAGN